MSRYREKLADKIREGYSCRTLFWVYFLFLILVGVIIATMYFYNR